MLKQIRNFFIRDTDSGRKTPQAQEKHGGQGIETSFEISPKDPLLHYFQSAHGVVDINRLDLDSPALQVMKGDGVSIAVPLVSQGELIGLLNLGSRLSEQEYSADDRALLSNLATQAAPALRVAQLVRQQKEEARQRERIEQELRIARLIQQTLLPKVLPELPGWQVSAYYQPAREVGGDFYDFIELPEDQMGIIVADVTDKGVPAALVMATTRSMLRSAAEQLITPCYAVLNTRSGNIRYANAGHDLPYVRHSSGVSELYATGMPLGLMPDMDYEEKEVTIKPGETILFHSDGLAEAHNQQREMFGFPRLKEKMADHQGGPELINYLVDELNSFTGEGWEQEDDVTLVVVENTTPDSEPVPDTDDPVIRAGRGMSSTAKLKNETLTEFSLSSKPGNERRAIQKVSEAIEGLALKDDRRERLKTAVGEATMNAMEHGNQYQTEMPVLISVHLSPTSVSVRITDEGDGSGLDLSEPPDLESKLKGEQSPRGWGLFLIQNMVDEMNVIKDEGSNTIELIMELEGDKDGD
jgi:serine phosphatase RsbU (regulator of sigma subunit)/anti-sigma regulatory factor (Ser/Thr protein kinase)